ncbi:uncharacterized protein BX664DRAFT_289951 [Halteromyces radiatus]|uniref:uncharacterized protein n=1 Tax=Halteromyces radiatus TaxID=101107 RepID=UPI00221FDC61|nr:uncharacterized protein BX664DRAFT_289951 [Halteromyces radiatus]KAI8099701.1 hypothetical protein BX664DRAFT_289951 [Halteromyces radiatus]
MVCLGPRKKEKKSSLLSPDDAITSRGINQSSGATKRGSKLKPPSKVDHTTATTKRSVSPRTSVDGRLSQQRNSRTSLNSQRAVSPTPGRRPQSPQHSPRQSMTSARNTTPNSRPTHSRNTSAVSTASVKKSPVAQMRQDFDTLKVKNDANEQLIAQQQAELALLKQQLAQASPPSTPMLPPPADQPTPPISHSNTLSDLQQAQALLDKEEALKQKEQALAELQEKLEQASKNVPNIVVEPSTDELEAAEEKESKRLADLAEKEKQLAEKELALETQRQQVEQEQQSALEQVAMQMEKLRIQNEEAVAQLAIKEKELDNLRLQANNASHTEEQSDALIKLQQQLDEQKRTHEESLQQHELALVEKERLLKEQEQQMMTLRESHEESVRQLKTHQSGNILKIKQQHKQEIANLQQQMQQVEKTKQEQMQQQGDQAKQQQEYLDAELEKILHAFEQAQHNHTAQLQDLEQSHKTALSDLQQTHVDQLKTIGASQGYTSARYVPTQAISWPAPQPLSSLRKTNGPSPRVNRVILAASQSSTTEPILTPLDTKKVQLYISTVSGNPVIKKNQEHIQQLLESNQVKFELIDVAASEAALQYMKRSNNNGSSEGRAKEVPQLFVGGEFRGLYDDVAKHVEKGTLDELLVPAAERQWTEAERQALEKATSPSSSSSLISTPPPIRVLPSGPVQLPALRKTATTTSSTKSLLKDEDEELLKELEQEFKQGNVDLSQLDNM